MPYLGSGGSRGPRCRAWRRSQQPGAGNVRLRAEETFAKVDELLQRQLHMVNGAFIRFFTEMQRQTSLGGIACASVPVSQ